MTKTHEIIFAYTRADALADGVLIDVSPMAREAGFIVPVAVTATIWVRCVKVPPDSPAQDEAGRLWDLLNVCRWKIRGVGAGDSRVSFEWPTRNPDGTKGRDAVIVDCGPVDDGKPCLTIMLPEDD
jgi:hypothetical protein